MVRCIGIGIRVDAFGYARAIYDGSGKSMYNMLTFPPEHCMLFTADDEAFFDDGSVDK